MGEYQGFDRMWDFWSQLFDSSGFPARWSCGSWTPGHGWLHILSDLGIWSAYFVIPCVLGYYAMRRRGISRSAASLCSSWRSSWRAGLTHLMEAVIFWWPAYRLAGVLKLLTAVVSWVTVFALVRVTPQVMASAALPNWRRRSPSGTGPRATFGRCTPNSKSGSGSGRRNWRGPSPPQDRGRGAEAGRAAVAGEPGATAAGHGQRPGDARPLRRGAAVQVREPGLCREHRLTPSDVVGRTIPEVVGERAYELLRANVDAALAGQRVEFEVESPYEGTGKRWLHYTFLPHRSDSGAVQGFLAVILDVTERRKAEELLRTITDTVPALIAYVDREGRYRLNNRAYEQWFGHPRSEMAGRHMRDVLGEPAWAVIEPRFEAALAGQTVRYEAPVPYKDGGMRWVDATYTPHLDAGGEVDGVVTLVNDITDKKRAETALRESEEQFRQFANAMPQIVWTARPDGHIDYYNERWYEYTGLPREMRRGRELEADPPPGRLAKTTDAWHAAVHSGRPYEIEHRFKNATTGEYRWHMGRAVPVRDEQADRRWFGTSTDIHDKKLAEEELRELNATLEQRVAQRRAEVEQRAKELRDQTRLLESIVNSVAEGVVVADENGKFLLFNPAGERMLGVGAHELPGRRMEPDLRGIPARRPDRVPARPIAAGEGHPGGTDRRRGDGNPQPETAQGDRS